jgi:hypothetical protein
MECLEGVVHEERGPHDRLQDGDDVFARPLACCMYQISAPMSPRPKTISLSFVTGNPLRHGHSVGPVASSCDSSASPSARARPRNAYRTADNACTCCPRTGEARALTGLMILATGGGWQARGWAGDRCRRKCGLSGMFTRAFCACDLAGVVAGAGWWRCPAGSRARPAGRGRGRGRRRSGWRGSGCEVPGGCGHRREQG